MSTISSIPDEERLLTASPTTIPPSNSPSRGRRSRRSGSYRREGSNVSVGSAQGGSESLERGDDELVVRSRKNRRKEKKNLTLNAAAPITAEETFSTLNTQCQEPLDPEITCSEHSTRCSIPFGVPLQRVERASSEQRNVQAPESSDKALNHVDSMTNHENKSFTPNDTEAQDPEHGIELTAIIPTPPVVQQSNRSSDYSPKFLFSSEHHFPDMTTLPKPPEAPAFPTPSAPTQIAIFQHPEHTTSPSIARNRPQPSTRPSIPPFPLSATPTSGTFSPVIYSPAAPTTQGRKSRFFPAPRTPRLPPRHGIPTPPRHPSKRKTPPNIAIMAQPPGFELAPVARKTSVDKGRRFSGTLAVGGDMSQLRIKTGGFFDGREGEDSDGVGVVEGVGWEEDVGWEGRDEGFWRD